MTKDIAQQVVEQTARDSYGRLVAWLAAHCGDVVKAEDAVADALEAALRTWPRAGIPDNPQAWLLTAARRRVIDRVRRDQTHHRKSDRLRMDAQEAAETAFRTGVPDRRLALMFVCAHPEIPARARTPLMLQTVLGVRAERIASAMLVRPATMSQRLVRAKRRIQEAGLAFEVPSIEAHPERLGFVLDAIYAAYGTGWEAGGDSDTPGTGLASEAIWLAQLLVDLAPAAAEAKGVLALMLYCESRRQARRSADGAFVPLGEQDPSRWDHELILEAEKALWMASRLHQGGPYQLEAAIQSIHAHRARSGRTDWAGVHRLYRLLVMHHPSMGASIGLAASYGRMADLEAGISVLDGLDAAAVARHQPYWAVRAYLLGGLGRTAEASHAYAQAVGLSEDPAVRRWLLARQAEVEA